MVIGCNYFMMCINISHHCFLPVSAQLFKPRNVGLFPTADITILRLIQQLRRRKWRKKVS